MSPTANEAKKTPVLWEHAVPAADFEKSIKSHQEKFRHPDFVGDEEPSVDIKFKTRFAHTRHEWEQAKVKIENCSINEWTTDNFEKFLGSLTGVAPEVLAYIRIYGNSEVYGDNEYGFFALGRKSFSQILFDNGFVALASDCKFEYEFKKCADGTVDFVEKITLKQAHENNNIGEKLYPKKGDKILTVQISQNIAYANNNITLKLADYRIQAFDKSAYTLLSYKKPPSFLANIQAFFVQFFSLFRKTKTETSEAKNYEAKQFGSFTHVNAIMDYEKKKPSISALPTGYKPMFQQTKDPKGFRNPQPLEGSQPDPLPQLQRTLTING